MYKSFNNYGVKPIKGITPNTPYIKPKYKPIKPQKPAIGINISNFTNDIYKVNMTDLRNYNLKTISLTLDKEKNKPFQKAKNIFKQNITKESVVTKKPLNYYIVNYDIIKTDNITEYKPISIKDIFGFVDINKLDKNYKIIYENFISKIIENYEKEIIEPQDISLLDVFIQDYFRLNKIGFDYLDDEYNNLKNKIYDIIKYKEINSINKILNEDYLSDSFYETQELDKVLFQMSYVNDMINSMKNGKLFKIESKNEYLRTNTNLKFLLDNISNILFATPFTSIFNFAIKFGTILYDIISNEDKYRLKTLNLKGKNGKIKKFNELSKSEKEALEFYADKLDIKKDELYKYIVDFQKILNVYKIYSNSIFK